MKSLPWHVCVLIPARDEEDLLPRCLHSVLAARARLPAPVTCDIVVAVDSSTDRTLEIAERMVGDCGLVLSTDAGVVGRVRALAADAALARYPGVLSLCWLANTDADCCVPETWLVEQLTLAREDVEAVVGTVGVDSFREHGPGIAERFKANYVIRPDGSHPHVHGANLGIRADVYRRVGGWRELATAEDHDLWNRLCQANAKRLSIGHLRVLTSGRRVGRAPHGFAEALAAHNETAA